MDNSLSTKKYFQQCLGKGTNFFDDIPSSSSEENVTSSQVIFNEVPETPMLQNTFNNVSAQLIEFKGANDINHAFSLEKRDSTETQDLAQNSEEPVVCRIFSSLQNEPSKTQEVHSHLGSSFFDMLGAPMLPQELSHPFSMGDKGFNFMMSENDGSLIGK